MVNNFGELEEIRSYIHVCKIVKTSLSLLAWELCSIIVELQELSQVESAITIVVIVAYQLDHVVFTCNAALASRLCDEPSNTIAIHDALDRILEQLEPLSEYCFGSRDEPLLLRVSQRRFRDVFVDL